MVVVPAVIFVVIVMAVIEIIRLQRGCRGGGDVGAGEGEHRDHDGGFNEFHCLLLNLTRDLGAAGERFNAGWVTSGLSAGIDRRAHARP